MCLILAGIHCYMGLHVLARGVIFVDLSLAQVSAFGATFAMLLGFEHHSSASYGLALMSTLLAALVFAWARKEEKRFPQEAVIGVTYALASAAVILVTDRLAHGAEHIKELLVGQILWVTWGDVARTALIYGVVSLIHWYFRRPLLAASFKEFSKNSNEPTLKWDFLFYALFGVVITSSVSFVGVLQVFAYLIVPALVVNAYFSAFKQRLLLGWLLGSVLSFVGISLSYLWDFPPGAFIVVSFAIFPLILLLFTSMRKSLLAR